MLTNKEKDAAMFLRCSSVLEEEMFQLYHAIAQKTQHPDVRSLLIGLAYDSLKHSKMVRELSKNIIGPNPEAKDCKRQIGELLTNVHVFFEEVSVKEEITDEDLTPILKDIADSEDLIYEKYSVLVQPRILQFVVAEISRLLPADLETLKSVFEIIIKDKENHRDILIAIIYYFATRKLEETKDNTPIVRYQNPNGWSRPLEA
jgi:rubrerythrin